jgi:ubiquinone/menaquinone biosynthesis C-methylase UbiE
MSKQLSKIFARVDAVDISPAMIAYARSHVTEDNIAWHVGTGSTLPIPTESVTGAFSCHVFQHFSDESVAYAYFKEIWRVLKPGGTLLIHLPLFRHHRNRRLGVISNALYRTYRAVYQVYGHLARLRMKMGGKPHMHGLSYEERALAKELTALSFSNIQFQCKWNDSDPLTVVLATK